MEEYLNLYHQKLWEVAFANVIRIFINPLVLFSIVLFYPIILYHFIVEIKQVKRLLVISSIPLILGLSCLVAEYIYSHDKIMNPDSPYNDSLSIASLKHETVLPILEHVDEIRLASVDGELKTEDIILFAVSNPTYYDGLFVDMANSLAGEQTIGKAFLVALVGFEEKNGEWQSVDIRIAPGVEEKDFQKFSKILHIKRGEREGATGIILDLQDFYEKKLEKEKNGD